LCFSFAATRLFSLMCAKAFMPNPKFDLVLFGATGFTGVQTFIHLARHVPRNFRWAIAGRNAEKLANLLPISSAALAQPKVLVADSGDPARIEKLVASTRVIIQLAGPYGRNGESFLAACAKHGTHYLDLSGEIGWVADMIEKYHDAAVASGAKIVPVCGFEALPFDIAALMIAQRLKIETGEPAEFIEVINQFTGPPALRPRDVLSGGTTASIKAMLESVESSAFSDPAVLVSDSKRAAAIREQHPYDFRARFSGDVDAWLAPTVPAPFVNPPVVYRTMSLMASSRSSPFAKHCGYREAMSTRSFAPLSLVQRVIAEMLSTAFIAMGRSISRDGKLDRIGRGAAKTLLDWIGPASGQGPSEKHLEQSGYTLWMRATAGSCASVTGHGTARGHPGYRSTAMLVAEAGLLLAGAAAAGCGALPRRSGVLTPASAFGTAATAAWERAGLVFEANGDSNKK
jgi:short subunit dehydrogenase-like uncharacterized protein